MSELEIPDHVYESAAEMHHSREIIDTLFPVVMAAELRRLAEEFRFIADAHSDPRVATGFRGAAGGAITRADALDPPVVNS